MLNAIHYRLFPLALAFILASLALPCDASMARGPGVVNHLPAGYLGIDVRDVSEEQIAALKLRDARGAEIVRVDHDGPAGKSGLRAHDIVLTLNGQPVEGEEPLRRMLRELAPGRTVALLVSRDGQIFTITSQMANREMVERQAWEQHMTVPEPPNASEPKILDVAPADERSMGSSAGKAKSFLGSMLLMSPSYTGAMLEVMSPQLADFFGASTGSGLLVRSVEGNSPAAIAGLHAGDVLIRANAKLLVSTSDWAKTIKESKGRPVAVVVLRDKREIILTLIPDGKRRSAVEEKTSAEWACLTQL